MRNYNLKFNTSVFLLSTFYFLLSTFFASAQTAEQPQFFVSWKTDSYAPTWYLGRIFPTKGSKIQVSFDLIDKGKPVNLSNYKVRWYLNDNLMINEKNGLGITSYSFTNFSFGGREAEVRVVLPDYSQSGQIGAMVKIPIVRPEVVIDAPYAGNLIPAAKNSFSAIPFFFNVKNISYAGDLVYKWFVDNREVLTSDENYENLELEIGNEVPKGTNVDVKVTVKSLLDELSFANDNMKMAVK